MMAFALALAQVGALVALAASMLPRGARWPALLALLSSAPLRYASELWAQWFLVTLSAVALAWIDKISAKHPPKAAPVVAEARGPVTNPPKASDDQRETVSVV